MSERLQPFQIHLLTDEQRRDILFGIIDRRSLLDAVGQLRKNAQAHSALITFIASMGGRDDLDCLKWTASWIRGLAINDYFLVGSDTSSFVYPINSVGEIDTAMAQSVLDNKDSMGGFNNQFAGFLSAKPDDLFTLGSVNFAARTITAVEYTKGQVESMRL